MLGIVHELAYLVQINHTKAFWNEVDKVLSTYLDRKQGQWCGDELVKNETIENLIAAFSDMKTSRRGLE